MPKQIVSSYAYFIQEVSIPTMKEHNCKMLEASKIISEKWKKMTPEDKQKYEAMSKKDAERYAK